MGSGVVAGGGLTLRLAALLLVVVNLGLPINELAAYAMLVASALLILTGNPSSEPQRWLAAIALTAALALTVVATLVPLQVVQERVLRIVVALLASAALACQITFAGRSMWATLGVYAAITATLLGVVLSVLRLLDRPRADRAAAATRETAGRV